MTFGQETRRAYSTMLLTPHGAPAPCHNDSTMNLVIGSSIIIIIDWYDFVCISNKTMSDN